MANFSTILTNWGRDALSRAALHGEPLVVAYARAGSGRGENPAMREDLAQPLNLDVQMGEMAYTPGGGGGDGVARVPVELTNLGLEAPVWVREIGLYAQLDGGPPLLLAYAWLDGTDSDNVLPAAREAGYADTVHVHELALVITTEQSEAVRVEVSPGYGVTHAQLVAYAAPLAHTQPAVTIREETGHTTEAVQRRQDADILALQSQLDTGFTGATVVHAFAPGEMGQWRGFEGGDMPEGVWDAARELMWA